MTSTRPKLFLIDAMYLVYRSYYAFSKKPPTTGSGLNTSAMLGFTNTIWDLLQKQRPTHFAVAFDSMEPTERHETFLDYKANREATPEDIITSIPYIYSICDAMNIPVLVSEGYEADDIIGTLARQAEAEGFNVFIFTADKDLGQCTSDHIFIYRPGRAGNPDEILGPEQVTARFGIKRVDQVADMLGLWGDASDNIPGIPGVGEVMAKKLLAEFDTVENLIQNYTKIGNPKLREKVGQYADQALLSKQLATILYDVPVTFNEEMFRVSKPDKQKLTPLFAELEFRNLAKRILDANDNETLAEKTARQEMHSEPEVTEVPEEKIKQ
ncbi:MAG: 5'-3' exonuclease H3TH domain-containing protein, partial [Bacteroidota bacterium]